MTNLMIKSIIKTNKITEAEIDKAIEDRKDVVGCIVDEALTDIANESSKLLNFYRMSNARDRAIIDAVLLYICGFRMKTLIERADVEIDY